MIRSQRGSTLFEVMFAVVLLGVAGVVFAASFPTGFSSIRQSSEYTTATAVAEKKAEQVRALDYASINYANLISLGILDPEPDALGSYKFTAVESLISVLPTGTGTMTIATDAHSVKNVTITIQWGSTVGADVKRGITHHVLVADITPLVQ